MPRDLFGDVVDPSIKMGNKSGYTVALTMIAEVVILAAIVIVPLMAADILPTPPSMMAFVACPGSRPVRCRANNHSAKPFQPRKNSTSAQPSGVRRTCRGADSALLTTCRSSSETNRPEPQPGRFRLQPPPEILASEQCGRYKPRHLTRKHG